MLEKQASISVINKYRYVFLMLLMIVLSSLNAGALVPLWGDFTRSIGGDLATAGIAVAILNLGTAFFTLIFSFVEVRWPNHNNLFVIFAFLLFALCYFGYFFIDNVPKLYLCLLGLSLASGIGWPAFDALYQTTFDQKTAALGWGAETTCGSIGSGLGAYVGAHIANGYNFHFLFAFMFVLSVLVALFSFIGLPRQLQTQSNTP